MLGLAVRFETWVEKLWCSIFFPPDIDNHDIAYAEKFSLVPGLRKGKQTIWIWWHSRKSVPWDDDPRKGSNDVKEVNFRFIL